MEDGRRGPITRQLLLDYFLDGALPRADWRVGMEIERLGRTADGGRPLPYEGDRPSVRLVLEELQRLRGGRPVWEADHVIGLDADWGAISLEPGGQVEWSSRPEPSLTVLGQRLAEHEAAMQQVALALGVRWLDVAVEPVLSVDEMFWMPKARYKIMRSYLGARGRLAQRMMTQTASIQCAFDYADPADWKRKFVAAATLTPLATALFANSSRADGRETGWRCYRQAIWLETDPARCGLPAIVFDPAFDVESWLDYVLDVPAIFRHRSRGLVPAGDVKFRELMSLTGCDAIRSEDWEIHASTVFTQVRSYTYLEVRSADLLPPDEALAVPALWTGLLYREQALDEALELGAEFASFESWTEGMVVAAREGLDGRPGGVSLRALAERAVSLAVRSLAAGATCAGEPAVAVAALERLAARRALDLR
jgi:glutamate--cysteine ligase